MESNVRYFRRHPALYAFVLHFLTGSLEAGVTEHFQRSWLDVIRNFILLLPILIFVSIKRTTKAEVGDSPIRYSQLLS